MVKTQLFAVTCANGELALMQIVLDDGRGIRQDASDPATVLALVTKATWAPEHVPLKSIRAIEQSDLPSDPSQRAAWIDTGTAIVVDSTRIRKPSLWQRFTRRHT